MQRRELALCPSETLEDGLDLRILSKIQLELPALDSRLVADSLEHRVTDLLPNLAVHPIDVRIQVSQGHDRGRDSDLAATLPDLVMKLCFRLTSGLLPRVHPSRRCGLQEAQAHRHVLLLIVRAPSEDLDDLSLQRRVVEKGIHLFLLHTRHLARLFDEAPDIIV